MEPTAVRPHSERSWSSPARAWAVWVAKKAAPPAKVQIAPPPSPRRLGDVDRVAREQRNVLVRPRARQHARIVDGDAAEARARVDPDDDRSAGVGEPARPARESEGLTDRDEMVRAEDALPLDVSADDETVAVDRRHRDGDDRGLVLEIRAQPLDDLFFELDRRAAGCLQV